MCYISNVSFQVNRYSRWYQCQPSVLKHEHSLGRSSVVNSINLKKTVFRFGVLRILGAAEGPPNFLCFDVLLVIFMQEISAAQVWLSPVREILDPPKFHFRRLDRLSE